MIKIVTATSVNSLFQNQYIIANIVKFAFKSMITTALGFRNASVRKI